MTYEYVAFPAWFYGPNGEAEIFESEAQVPAGWLDDPNKFAQKSETPDEEPAKRRGRPPKVAEVTEDEF